MDARHRRRHRQGAPAAALTSVARYSIRTAATLTGSPAEALRRLNEDLHRQGQESLLSAVCVLLLDEPDGARAVIAAAGHPLPVLVRDGTATPVGGSSLLLGVSPDARISEHEVRLDPDDTLVLYTDGVLDAKGASGRFGHERLMRALARAGEGAPARELLDGVVSALGSFQSGVQRDDVTMLAVRRERAVSAVAAVDAHAAGTP